MYEQHCWDKDQKPEEVGLPIRFLDKHRAYKTVAFLNILQYRYKYRAVQCQETKEYIVIAKPRKVFTVKAQ